MVIVKATEESEAGVPPTKEQIEEMSVYNEALINAGVLLAGEGLHATSKGARVKFSGDARTVVDGPFAESKEMIAGFWLWQVKSMDEAIEWAKRCPRGDGELDIRPVIESDDLGDALSPEVRAQEDAWRERSGFAERQQ